MKCIKCGTENQEGATFCSTCGNTLNNTNLGVDAVSLTENNVSSNVNVLEPMHSTSTVNSSSVQDNSNTSVAVNNGPVLGNVTNSIDNNATILQPVQNTSIVNNAVQPTVASNTVPGVQQQVVNNNGNMQVSSIGSVQSVTSQEGNNNSKKNKLKIILILLIVVLVLMIGLAIWVYFAGQEKLKEYEEMMENRIEITWTPGSDSEKYIAGTEVTLVDDSKWYVIGQDGDMVTLISSGYYGDKTHFSNSVNDYEKSVVKDIIDNKFLPELRNSLTTSGGDVTNLTARIISVEEIREVAGVLSTVENNQIELDSNYKWLYSPGSYWTSTQGVDDYMPDYTYVYFVTDFISAGYVEADEASYGIVNGNEFYIRPVIEINIANIKM